LTFYKNREITSKNAPRSSKKGNRQLLIVILRFFGFDFLPSALAAQFTSMQNILSIELYLFCFIGCLLEFIVVQVYLYFYLDHAPSSTIIQTCDIAFATNFQSAASCACG
jgi:hypothetical protein